MPANIKTIELRNLQIEDYRIKKIHGRVLPRWQILSGKKIK
jgi:hypothetical protein